jgi:hypothetical protein
MDQSLDERFAEIEAIFDDVESSLADPEVLSDPSQLAELGKKHSDLKDTVADIRRWRQANVDLGEAHEMSDDPDMAQMARELESEITRLEEKIKRELVPKDPNDEKDVIVEIRAGVGGDEASTRSPSRSRATTPTPGSSTKVGSIVSNGSPRPSRRGVSTHRPPPWRCCPRPTRSISRSTPMTSASTSIDRRGRGASR